MPHAKSAVFQFNFVKASISETHIFPYNGKVEEDVLSIEWFCWNDEYCNNDPIPYIFETHFRVEPEREITYRIEKPHIFPMLTDEEIIDRWKYMKEILPNELMKLTDPSMAIEWYKNYFPFVE